MADFSVTDISTASQAMLKQPQTSLAIVGMGCRFPGAADNPACFWNNLLAAKDCIVEVPENRWEVNRFYDDNRNKPGKMYVKSGGFLEEDIYTFDAMFFGVSPREAQDIDPQQRILMEVSWEALEDAGIDPESLSGSETGVFIGGFMLDNKITQLSPLNRHTIAANTAVGMTLTMLSNRLSYFYDLRGPSMTIDTACSASMVALDQACHSLWNGNSKLALVGGVNIMHRPEIFIGLCKGGFLAPDGRSKSFDARANGYGRGEGAGIIVIKPLADAERDGDRIYALIRSTASNQDGRTDGITVPNPSSQRALITKAANKAQVALKDIHYVEAHGTGTAVGDPLEISAIGNTIGLQRSPDNPCIVGSVKGNIGHLEAASGIAGIIKSVLCLQNRCVPPQANLQQLNPNIPFAEFHIKIPQQTTPLPQNDRHLYAAINSFGYGGSNACAILQNYTGAPEPLPQNDIDIASGQRFLLPLSASSKQALVALVNRYIEQLEGPNLANTNINDLCYCAGARRAHLNHRLCVSATNINELISNLRQYREQESSDGCIEGQVSQPRNKLAFVFTGMGPQWWGMGRELFDCEPVFRAAIVRCDRLFHTISGWSIKDEMLKTQSESRISETQIAQPANLILQIALVELLASWGIKPSAMVGHSVGEVTTSYISGMLSLEQALTVSFHRSRIQKKAANLGSMLAVGVNESEATALIEPFNGNVSIAAINGPTAITLAGDSEGLTSIAKTLEQRGVFNRMLQVEVAYHSHTMDPLLEEVNTSLTCLTPNNPSLPVYSTVTGGLIEGKAFNAEYWCRNVRQPVYFLKALKQMLADGFEDFIEIGPHPVLSSSIKECFASTQQKGNLISTLKRSTDEQINIKQAAATLYTHGYRLNWCNLSSSRFSRDVKGEKCHALRPNYVALPTYPWQRERHWNEDQQAQQDRIGKRIHHAVLGTREQGPAPRWRSQINNSYLSYIHDHMVEDLLILPGAAYIEAALCAYKELTGNNACLLSDIRLHNAMVIDNDKERLMQTLSYESSGNFEIHSFTLEDRDQHTLHATGNMQSLPPMQPQPIDIAALKAHGMRKLQTFEVYAELNSRGLQYGPFFQGIKQLWRSDGEVLAQIAAHNDLSLPIDNYQLHPTLLDACFQSLISALPEGSEFSQQVYIPTSIEQLRHYQKVSNTIYCHGTVHELNARSIRGDIQLCDETGQVLVEILDLCCQALRSGQNRTSEKLDNWAYQGNWQAQSLALTESNLAANAATTCHVLLINQDQEGEKLQGALTHHSEVPVITVFTGKSYHQINDHQYTLDPTHSNQLRRLFAEHTLLRSSQSVKLIYGITLQQHSDDPAFIQATGKALGFLQAVQQLQVAASLHVYLLTCDTQKVLDTDTCEGFALSPVIGLARVAAVEIPALQCTTVDLDHSLSTSVLKQLVTECLGASSEQGMAEQEIALRGKQRFVYRLCRSPIDQARRPELKIPGANENFELAPPPLTQIAGTPFQVCSRRKPSAAEIEIEVLSAVFNNEADDLQEVCARVVSVGQNISDYQIGAQIIACYRGNVGRFVTIDPTKMLTLNKPAAWHPTAAAGALSGLVLAHAALLQYSHTEAKSSVLILGSDTKNGQCLTQLAKSLGCHCVDVITKPPESCKTGLSLRSASLMRDVQALQPSAGFDVIVTVAGHLPHINIDSLLALRGHYINLHEGQGTTHSAAITLASGKAQLHLNQTAVLNATLDSPDKIQAQLQTLVTNLDSNGIQLTTLKPKTLSTNLNTQGVLSLACAEGLQLITKPSAGLRIKSHTTYLITGGFGGFGLGMAHWLIQQGARHLVLVSRSGARNASAKAAVAQLQSTGAQICSMAIDIADGNKVQTMLSSIDKKMPPLAGIFHTAGVLDDKELFTIDTASLERVMRPKALGAWHLHRLTQHRDLDCFVLYSSVSALIGNRNQTSYVAANLFLDNLAHYRHAHGLAATSINWGALTDVGMAADPNVIQHLEHIGIRGFTLQQAQNAFAQLMQTPVAQLGIFDVDWQRWSQFESASVSARFSELVATVDVADSADNWSTIYAQGQEALETAAASCFGEILAETLKLAAEHIDPKTPINRYGLDSLMAIDLQIKIREKCKVDISILELMKGNSIIQIAATIATKMTELLNADGEDRTANEPQVVATTEQLKLETIITELPNINHLEPVDDMVEEQLDALLIQELKMN